MTGDDLDASTPSKPTPNDFDGERSGDARPSEVATDALSTRFRAAADALDAAINGVWVPDLRLGIAHHETEAFLAHLHFTVRTSVIIGNAVRLLGRPGDVAKPGRAGVALALNAAAMSAMWSRSRTWQSLQDPRIRLIERSAGLVETGLATTAMTQRGITDPSSWLYRLFSPRIGASASFSDSPLGLVGHAAISFAPFLLSKRSRHPRALSALAIAAVPPTLAGAFVATGVRQFGKELNSTLGDAATSYVDHVIEDANELFIDDIVAPAHRSLCTLRELVVRDRDDAAAFAVEAEAATRRWLDHHERSYDPDSIDLPASQVETLRAASLRERNRTTARARAVYSTGLAIEALRQRHVGRSARATFAAFHLADVGLALAEARAAASGSAHMNELRGRRTSYDLARVVVTTGFLAANPTDSITQNLTNRATHNVIGGITPATRGPSRTSALLGAGARFALAFVGPRTTRAKVAAAATEVGLTLGDAAVVNHLRKQIIDRGASLVADATTERLVETRDEFNRVHTAQTALVHDGVAQVLGAAAARNVDDRELIAWIDLELHRLAAVLRERRVVEADGADNLIASLSTIAEQFSARSLTIFFAANNVSVEAERYGEELARIMREALSNVYKHSVRREAFCRLEQLGPVLTLSISSDTAPAPDAEPGTGLRTILRTAQSIGANVEWVEHGCVAPALHVSLVLETDTPSSCHDSFAADTGADTGVVVSGADNDIDLRGDTDEHNASATM